MPPRPRSTPEDPSARWNCWNRPAASAAAEAAAQAAILDVLAWAWDAIAEPVLTVLGHTASPGQGPWPRVLWCPVGIMAFFPLHAAGHHRDLNAGSANPRTVLDRVVSSYVSTVRSLGHSQVLPPTPGRAAAAPLIVAAADVPGVRQLPGVDREAAMLSRLFPHARRLPHPTCGAVLEALPQHTLVHFACHGFTNQEEAGASELVLYGRHTDPLTIAKISALRLNGALAYLSACETALTTQELANEAVHITGAFQLAGYQHVIGTLWTIDDTFAVHVARDFYRHLFRVGGPAPDLSQTSRALHEATRRLRSRYWDSPALWAAHTHTGP
jgi:hypothetical protein